MTATAFEFRNRFAIIGGLFGAAFSCYWIDRQNAATALLLQLGLSPGTPAFDQAQRGALLFSTLVVALAALLRTWGNAYLRSEVVRDGIIHTGRLVADGPYRHVRNPLYLANVLLAVGMGLLCSRMGWSVLVLGMLLFVLRLIGREETGLLAAQGERYRAYLAAVPRLWPALWPRVSAGTATARWAQAFAGEAWMWGLALSTGAFALTANMRVFWMLLGASAALYLLLLPLWRRRARSLAP